MAISGDSTQAGVRTVVLVEDDPDIAYTIRLNLRKDVGCHVEHFTSGNDAIDHLHRSRADLVILDLNLPDVDGLAVCREIRSEEQTRGIPIIMLTARIEERDKLVGFELGADDYVTKPFSMRELLARVRAQLRRASRPATADVWEGAGLRVDRQTFEVALDGNPVHLTKKEFELLWHLIQNASRVLPRESILARLWGYESDVETRTVDVHIRSLRKKLGDRWIETVVGVGYRFRPGSRE